MRIALLTFAMFTSFAASAWAQSSVPASPEQAKPTTAAPTAAQSDVSSVDAIMKALYDSISGPAGKPRDWDRLRSLFLPDARMMPVSQNPDSGEVGIRMLSVDDYVRTSASFIEKRGFHETEKARYAESFGHIAYVMSSYEARTEVEPIQMVGTNTLQLMNDGKRWWIVSLMWESQPTNKVLPKYYPAKD